MLHSFRRIVYSCELITLFALHLRNGSCEIIQLSLYSVRVRVRVRVSVRATLG